MCTYIINYRCRAGYGTRKEVEGDKMVILRRRVMRLGADNIFYLLCVNIQTERRNGRGGREGENKKG